MDDRIEELYIQELEKDIVKKVKQIGYEVKKCKVDAQISDKEENTKITKIKLNIEKNENSDIQEQVNQTEKIENKIVTEIQKIKTINTTIENNQENTSKSEEKTQKLDKSDIQNIKKFLIEEYEVDEKCLEIN